FLRSGQRHSVLGYGIELFLNPVRAERSDRISSDARNETVRPAGKVLHRQQIGRDGDETVRGELISDAPNPRRKSEYLMDDYYHRCLGASLRINDPGVQAVSIASADHPPLAMARRRGQTCRGTGGIGWQGARRLGGNAS